MKNYKFLYLILFLLTSQLYAQPGFDIYGVDANTQNQLFSSCAREVQMYVDLLEAMKKMSPAAREKKFVKLKKIDTALSKKINQFGKFHFYKVSIIYYPDRRQNFVTLDLVKEEDKNRFPRTSREVLKTTRQNQELKALFSIWNTYINKKFKLVFANKLDLKSHSCPVAHCTWGFDKQELKTIVPKINSGVEKYKESLMEIIKYGKNNEDRENAILLLGHDKNYQAVANLLIQYMNDPDDGVRNNSMRVLAAILSKHNIPNLSVDSVVAALNYPYVTDRNKAAYILLNIVKKDKSSHQQVTLKAGAILMQLLKLQQPNNHDMAYQILTEISHQKYDERDYPSWQKWLDSKSDYSQQISRT